MSDLKTGTATPSPFKKSLAERYVDQILQVIPEQPTLPPVKTAPIARDPRTVLVEHGGAIYSLHRVIDGTVFGCLKEAELITAPSAWRL